MKVRGYSQYTCPHDFENAPMKLCIDSAKFGLAKAFCVEDIVYACSLLPFWIVLDFRGLLNW